MGYGESGVLAMLAVETFNEIVTELRAQGWADDDIAWAESLGKPPETPEEFAIEVIYVICNSGMKFTVARKIFEKCRDALLDGRPVAAVFNHKGKSAAFETIWRNRGALHQGYLACRTDPERIEWLETLPWIGPTTRYHAAKNFGVSCAKPDVHLERLAAVHGTDAQNFCADLAAKTGYKVATIDTLIWRACAVGVIDSHTGSVFTQARS